MSAQTQGLERVGPTSTVNGYPTWYQDTTGVTLEFCSPLNTAERVGITNEAGQFLSAAHLVLAKLANDADPALLDELQKVRRNLDEVEGQLRGVSREMHPRIVEDLGLPEAIQFLTGSLARRTRIEITVESSLADTPRPRAVDTLLYRFVQEGLTNVARHAQATRVVIALGGDEASVRCSVRDNGIGCDAAAGDGRGFGLGLRIMEDRKSVV